MKNLNLLSDSYSKFRDLLGNPNANIEEFSEILSGDPGMASMVLRIANHDIFGFKGQIESIDHAINLLGIGQIAEMVLEVNQILPLEDLVSMQKANNVVLFPVRKSWQAASLCA